MEKVTREELISRYCAWCADSDPEFASSGILTFTIRQILLHKAAQYNPNGFMLCRCNLNGSAHFGKLFILPFGPRNVWKEMPTGSFSALNLANDTCEVIAWCEEPENTP